MKPQTAQVLGLLKVKGDTGVTQQDSIRALGCYRLAARVADLKAAGYRIDTELVTVGDKRFARYTLRVEPVQLVAFD